MARQFRRAGHALVEAPEDADLMVLNTCTVTAGADSESRRRVRRAHRRNPELKIAVTGCWASLNPEGARQLPGVTAVTPNEQKSSLPTQLVEAPLPAFERDPIQRRPLPGVRMRTRAYIKAQDGCNHHCAYCLTTIARGSARSLPIRQVLHQVQAAEAGGAKEAVLSGVQLSSCGRDLEGEIDLTDLITTILAETRIPRIRLSSLEPWGVPDGFFDLWADRRLCRQLHLPLQSGCAQTLRRMSRPMTPNGYAQLAQSARGRIPDLALTTDVIVGFPGEDEGEFEESLRVIESMAFADAHVFPFSPRPGTPAAHLPDPVPSRIAKGRAGRVQATVERTADAFRRQFVGREMHVLWEAASGLGPAGWRLNGLTDNYLRVTTSSVKDRWNTQSRVRMVRVVDGGLEGQLIPPP